MHGYAVIVSLFFSQETCDDNLNITMCPLCDGVCDYWHLSTVCSLARASYLFDNGATVLFAIFMSLWGTYIRHTPARLRVEWLLAAVEVGCVGSDLL